MSRQLTFLVLMPHRPPGNYLWDFLPDSVHTVQLEHYTDEERQRRGRPLGELRNLAALARRGLQRVGRPDVIVSVGARTGAMTEALLALRGRRRVPTAVLECILYPQGGLRGRAKRRLLGSLLVGARAVVCSAGAEAELYRQQYGLVSQQLHVIPFFVADDVFARPPREVVAGRVFAGGNSYRDYHLLAAAVEDTPLTARLITSQTDVDPAALPANVELLPPVQREVFLDELAAAEVVALPLHPVDVSAGQVVLLQAMALGRPVVTTDSPAIRDYVIPDETAVVVPCGDRGALRQALLELHQDEARREQLGRRAREVARERFSGRAHALQVERLLERLAGGGVVQ